MGFNSNFDMDLFDFNKVAVVAGIVNNFKISFNMDYDNSKVITGISVIPMFLLQ